VVAGARSPDAVRCPRRRPPPSRPCARRGRPAAPLSALGTAEELEERAEDDPEALITGDDPFAEVNDHANEIGLTECGEEEDDGDEETEDGEDAAGEIEPDPDDRYCDTEAQIDAIFDEGFSSAGPNASEEQLNAVITATSQAVVDSGLLEEAEANAPDAIADDLDVLIAAVRSAAQGDTSAFIDGSTDAAGERVDAYCGV